MAAQPPESPESKTPQTDNPEKLKQFVKDARKQAGQGGDVNVANIGQGAQVDQIAVGRNILQAKINIGALVIPVRFLLALLGVVAIIAVVVWWFAIPWTMPAGSSIAIVDFAEKNSSGQLVASTFGKRYAEYMSDQMSKEVNAFPLKPVPTIWHISSGMDPVAAFSKRLWVAPVGADKEAKALADHYSAQVVAYGSVEIGDRGVNISPKFFVRQGRGEADELSDPQQMGQAITVDIDNNSRLDTHLFPLTKALLYLTEGLWAQLDGDFVQSYSIFNRAEEQLRDELAYPRELGKEVLYYFLGESAMLLSQCESDARQVFRDPNSGASFQALNTAENAFQRSLQISKEQGRVYPRALFGLAQIAFGRGERVLFPPEVNTAGQCRLALAPRTAKEPDIPQYVCPLPSTVPGTELLDRARRDFQQALRFYDDFFAAPESSQPSRLNDRARAARANTQVTIAALDVQLGKPAEAETRLRAQIPVLETVVAQMDPEDKRAASETYFALGNAYNYLANVRAAQGYVEEVKPNLLRARDALTLCITTIGDTKFLSDRFKKVNILPSCSCARQSVQKTLEQLP